jgi:hypothetical protein
MIEKEQLQHAADLKQKDSIDTRSKSQAPPRQDESRTFNKPDVNPERLAQMQIEKSRNNQQLIGSGTYLQTEPVYGSRDLKNRKPMENHAKFQEAMN